MRVYVIGDCAAARAMRGDLRLADFHVLDEEARPLPEGTVPGIVRPSYIIRVTEVEKDSHFLVDGAGGEFDRLVISNLRALSGYEVHLQTDGIVDRENEVGLMVPETEDARQAAETSVLRALLTISKVPPVRPDPDVPVTPWSLKAWLKGLLA